MLAVLVVIATTAAFAVEAVSFIPPSYNTSTDFVFLPPGLEPFIHAEFYSYIPTNTTTVLGLIGRAPNMGGNVTGAITGSIVPVGAAYELIPDGPEGIRSIYSNTWSINASSTTAGTDDGTATIIMHAQAFVQYANEAVFGMGSISFEGRPGTNLSYEAFVGQVSANYNEGVGLLDVFRVIPGKRVNGKPIKALLPPGQGELSGGWTSHTATLKGIKDCL